MRTMDWKHGLDLMRTATVLRFDRLPAYLGSLILWFVVFQVSLVAQEPARLRLPPAALPQSAQLETVLKQGQNLEQSRRWGDALSHYERAIKLFPGHPALQQRFRLAQTHCDVARRYADTSFTRFFQRSNERKAVDIYTEVLTKIQTYYVESPNWRHLVQRGTDTFLAALHDPVFLQTHLPDLTAEKRLALSGQVRRHVTERQITSRHQAQQVVLEVARVAQQQTGLRTDACIMEYTCGALTNLDLYSSFLTASQLKDVFSQIEGNFVGLGIELKCEKTALRIVGVISGGPAHQFGLTAGDLIVSVNGRLVKETTAEVAADMLRGPAGSQVQVTILKADGQERPVTLPRRRVEVPSVEHVKILRAQDGIAYFKITSFQKTTKKSVEAALWKLHRAGMRGLILDLRGNPGGLLNASIDLADMFLSQGLIVSTRGRSAQEDVDYRAHDLQTFNIPLVVLIDRDSASASEVFAGAIHDHRRALVVGERSYGKGSVQGIFPLTATSAGIRLTTAKFYSPNGQAISRRGVTPDVVVQRADKPQIASGEAQPVAADTMLETAIQLLQKKVDLAAQQR